MIKLLVLDVDGCLTNGQIIYSNSSYDNNLNEEILSLESKAFNVKDGLAIRTWLDMGNYVAIITGKKSEMVARRAKELKISFLHQKISDKLSVLQDIAKELNIEMNQIAAIGDDLNDYKMLKAVGRSYTPNDGAKHIKSIVNMTLKTKGGEGAVREMIEDIIDIDSQEEAFLKQWL
jgi:3-deoxy-D-manno-octulosonate 8-phosphate phosphatase (KDO 8-P phosphatase)